MRGLRITPARRKLVACRALEEDVMSRFIVQIDTRIESFRVEVTAKDQDEAISFAVEQYLDVDSWHLKELRTEQMSNAEIRWKPVLPVLNYAA